MSTYLVTLVILISNLELFESAKLMGQFFVNNPAFS